MNIDERKVGTVTVLDLKGKLTLGDGDEALKNKIQGLVGQGQKQILLNFAGVPYVDSSGLGAMIGCYTTVTRAGGSLRLVNLTNRLTDLLSITKLLTVFDTYTTESEAVGSFSAAV
jgi:anti-sigma B factor antagonist